MPILGIYSSQLTGKWKNWFNLTSTSLDLVLPSLAIDSSFNTNSTFNNSGNGLQIAQYSQQGRINWQRRLTSSTDSITSSSIILDSSNNLYVSGYGSSTFYIVKYDSSGTLQWQRTLSVSSNQSSKTFLAIDSSSNIYMAGTVFTGTYYVTELVKYNSSGTLQWQLQIDRGASLDLIPIGIQTDSSSNVYVTFTDNSSTTSYLMKYNSAGTLQWQYSINSSNFYNNMLIDSSGNIYLGIDSNSIVKLDSSLTTQWINKISSVTTVQRLFIDSSSNIYAVGAAGTNGVILQLNSSGVLQWQRTLSVTGTGFDIQNATYDSNNNNIIPAIVSSFPSGTTAKVTMAVLPNDGSLTGTYKVSGSNVVYATSSFTTSTPTSPTLTATSYNSTTTTYTGSTPSLTNATSSLSSNFYIM